MHNGRMLILEDDPHVGKIMKLIGEASGLDVRLLSESQEFFKLVRQWNPTHIALDLVMPDMDGVQVLEELASRHCNAKIIITSGMGIRMLDAAGRTGHERGLKIAGLLSKPFSAASMRALLRDVPESAQESIQHPNNALDANWIDLRDAVQNRQFQVVYQPKVECASGRLAGFEALARWIHPERGVIMPVQFIPMMDKYGLTDLLTDQVLKQALPWFSALSGELTLSVNLSAQTFHDTALLESLVSRCAILGIPPYRLILEVTEANSMADPRISLEWMTRVRDRGYRLALDDFGTGYSSLLQLVRLPFSEIKVDHSFVMAAGRSTESRTVIRSIVALGRSLGLKSTAEGVEDPETLGYLKSIGCDFAQGYGIAPPMDGEAVREWLAGRA